MKQPIEWFKEIIEASEAMNANSDNNGTYRFKWLSDDNTRQELYKHFFDNYETNENRTDPTIAETEAYR